MPQTHGHEAAHPLRDLPGLHPEDEVADDEAHEQAAEEAGLRHRADVADDEAGDDARALGDGIGHVGAQDGNREVHRVAAEHVDAPPEATPGEGLHAGERRCPGACDVGVVAADLPASEALGESAQDAAGDDHRNHVRDSGHDRLHDSDFLDLRHCTPSFPYFLPGLPTRIPFSGLAACVHRMRWD